MNMLGFYAVSVMYHIAVLVDVQDADLVGRQDGLANGEGDEPVCEPGCALGVKGFSAV